MHTCIRLLILTFIAEATEGVTPESVSISLTFEGADSEQAVSRLILKVRSILGFDTTGSSTADTEFPSLCWEVLLFCESTPVQVI